MKRDWDIIRELLSQIEDETLPAFVNELHRDVQFGKGDPVFESDVARHLKLLADAGFVKGVQFANTSPKKVCYVRVEPDLTMEGYDLLEVLRSKSIWASVKEQIKTTGAGLTVEAIKVFASQAIRKLSE